MATLRQPEARLLRLALPARIRSKIGLAIAAVAIIAALLLTVGPLSGAMPWSHRGVDVTLSDVAQVTLNRPLAFDDVQLIDANGMDPDVPWLIEALRDAKGLGHPPDQTFGGYPDTVQIERSDGTQLNILHAPVCLERNDEGDCFHSDFARDEFLVWDSRVGGQGEVYASDQLGPWFDEVFARYY